MEEKEEEEQWEEKEKVSNDLESLSFLFLMNSQSVHSPKRDHTHLVTPVFAL